MTLHLVPQPPEASTAPGPEPQQRSKVVNLDDHRPDPYDSATTDDLSDAELADLISAADRFISETHKKLTPHAVP